MTHDVKQWLAEIKSLQQKLENVYKERDEAFAGAANWRKLYETEAKQRRTEANLARQTIESLKEEIQVLQLPLQGLESQTGDRTAIQQEVENLKNIQDLKEKLVQALTECRHLTQALKAEQMDHERTRKALTDALGDTMNALARERAGRNGLAESVGSGNHLSEESALQH
jgi:chromosome segregation ATPase